MKLQLFQPIKPFSISQGFGVNGDYYQKNGINIRGHNGFDLVAKHGQPVYAAHDGVAYYETDEQQGQGVVIRTNEMFDYNDGQCYFKTIYWHLCDPLKEPQFASPIFRKTAVPVKRGDLIGYADNTGFSTGDHLHWGLKPIMPSLTFMPEDATDEGIGAFRNIEMSNGYLGAIDPTPYLLNTSANAKYDFLSDFGFCSIGSNVTELQRRLGVSQTGFFWLATQAAVKAFQKANYIATTGYVGPLTRAALNRGSGA